jgi:hypothetical protein
MNTHLSPERISKWAMGEQSEAERQHVLECRRCAAEVWRLESALAEFGGAVRDWSERQTVVKPSRDGRRARPLRWAWVAALAMLVAAAVPLYRVDQQRKLERARADAALMEQVDREVSRAIATPMEPLAKLMTWDENNETTSH